MVSVVGADLGANWDDTLAGAPWGTTRQFIIFGVQ